MKQKLPKDQRKALRFAYELMCGEYKWFYLPYIHGIILQREHGKLLLRSGCWIEPDQDSDRLYLNESVLAHLTMHEYFECQQFLPGPKWLYRLTRAGCMAMGWKWPLDNLHIQNGHVPLITRLKQQEEIRERRNTRNSFFRSGRGTQQKYYFPHKHTLYHRLHK